MRVTRRIFTAVLFATFGALLAMPGSVHGIAKQSSISMNLQSGTLSVSILPTPDGNFAESTSATLNVSTDNFTGYTVSVSSSGGTSLVNNDEDAVTSISSPITQQAFSTNSAYNNKWGFKPSQYVTESGGTYTTVNNTDFLPAPTDLMLARTTAANSTANSYTFSFGARVDMALPADTYTGTYIITAVANSIVYNITYNKNTSETVTNMPSPNPQALEIDGGTPAADSYGTLSSAIPTMTTDDMSFGGWCTTTTTVNATTQNYECSGTVYQPGDDYPIDQTVDGTNITLYAIWIKDPFPMVWSQMGKCIFDGAVNDTDSDPNYVAGKVHGSECQTYMNDSFIDTGVALYSNANYQKDYQVHFTIDRYIANEQSNDQNQATIFNDKLSSSVTASPYGGKSPGIVVRRNSSNIEIKSTYTTTPLDRQEIISRTGTGYAGIDVSIYRIDGVIYTSINNGPLIELQDMTNPAFSQYFGLSAWFGAYPDNVNCTENCTAAKRFLEGELSNMYIKLGDFDSSNLHTITLDANGGTLAGGSTILIVDGNAIGNSLEYPTRTDWLFDGWLDENDQLVTAATVPDSDETYTAQWTKSVALATITNDTITIDVGDTETINVTNSNELEPYTFSSSNDSVATVNSSGLVTGAAAGTTTITMTGTRSGATKTISVSVIGGSNTVTFDADGGYSVSSMTVGQGATLSEIPYTEKSGYVLDGWYTGTNGSGTKLDTSTVIMNDITYHAYWLQGDFVCKVAESLHTEQCLQTTGSSGGGCRSASFSASQVITYGHLVVSSSTITPGAAYDCDVDYDGVFDDDTERFYYFGTENGNAKLVHYANLSNESQYYADAIGFLPNYELDQQSPTTPVWDNPHLVTHTTGDYAGKAARFMTYSELTDGLWDGTNTGITPSDGSSLYLFEKSAFANTNITDGIWLELEGTDITSRIQTRSRTLTHGKNKTSKNAPRATIDVPDAYLEKYFVPPANYVITFDPQNETSTFTETINPGSQLGPAYPSTDPTYANHLFQGWFTASTGGTQISSATIPSNDTTYYAQWKGTVALAQAANSTITIVEGGNATVSVTNAADLEDFTFSSSNTNIATIDSQTGAVSGIAEGTAYISITGSDSHTTNSNIVTVNVVDASSVYHITFDPQNGDSTSSIDVVIGNAINGQMPASDPTWTNHTFQRWYDSATGNTVTSATQPTGNMTVYAEWKLDVTQATLSNNDLTVSAGGQINLGVSNASQLESYTLSSQNTSVATIASDGTITGVAAGTTNIIMTGSQSGLTKSFEVDVTAAPTVQYRVTFNANGGSLNDGASSTRDVDDGDPVGTLPTASKTNYKFFGWYTDDGTFYDEVYPETIVDADITYYAKWEEDTSSFPIVWSEINECTFTGTTVTGTYCSNTNNSKYYIDTNVQLFTAANYNKDFEVGFTITEYDPANQLSGGGNQATFVSSKKEDSANQYPGFVIRRYSGTNFIEITSRWKDDTQSLALSNFPYATTKTIKLQKRKETEQGNDYYRIYYSINGGAWTLYEDVTNKTHFEFDIKVWFGAAANSNGTSPMRPLVGKMTDMYVKLGVESEYLVELDANGGTLPSGAQSNYTINIGDPVGALPTPTAPSANYTFGGWYNGNTLISDGTQFIPTSNVTLVADWVYNSSDTPVTFDVSNNATRGYKSIINNWVGSPVNITTFNKDTTTINDSTWGDTSELTEVQFWTALKNNFETNNCLKPSYGDAVTTTPNPTAWTNGSVDCAKPDVYDTLIGAPLNVYLYNNQTLGAQVTYANASDGIIRNLIPGNTYKWVKDGDSSVYGYVTVTSNGSDYGTRWLDTGQVRNVRDLGGLPADTDNDGAVDAYVDYGRLFRGEQLWNVPATTLTNLGITKEYDVGNPSEYASNVTQLSNYKYDPVIHYNFDYNSGDENNANSNYMKAWNAVTDIMNDIASSNNPQNIYFHCRVGADRTGTTAYLLEGLLGVPDEERYQEYELTHLSGLFDRTRYYKLKNASNNYYKFVFMMDYVQTTSDIITWYNRNPNVDSTLISRFRAAMTTPIQQSSPSPAPANNSNQALNTNNNSSNGTNSTDSTNSSSIPSSQDNYSAPLNATRSADVNDTSSIDGVAVVAATAVATATAGSLAYTLAKDDKVNSHS